MTVIYNYQKPSFTSALWPQAYNHHSFFPIHHCTYDLTHNFYTIRHVIYKCFTYKTTVLLLKTNSFLIQSCMWVPTGRLHTTGKLRTRIMVPLWQDWHSAHTSKLTVKTAEHLQTFLHSKRFKHHPGCILVVMKATKQLRYMYKLGFVIHTLLHALSCCYTQQQSTPHLLHGISCTRCRVVFVFLLCHVSIVR